MQNVVAVIGPTASGKTALSVELAKRFSGEIISADSMQIYKTMDIATAKPTEDEKQGVPHHLMDFLDPSEDFSVARFCELAKIAITDIIARDRLPIVTGGTGLYVDALLGDPPTWPHPVRLIGKQIDWEENLLRETFPDALP